MADVASSSKTQINSKLNKTFIHDLTASQDMSDQKVPGPFYLSFYQTPSTNLFSL